MQSGLLVQTTAEYDEASGTTSVVNHITYDSFGNVTSETAAVAAPAWPARVLTSV